MFMIYLMNQPLILTDANNTNSINKGDGTFEYVNNKHYRLMLQNAFAAISQTENWDFVKQDPGPNGFMGSSSPKIWIITKAMEKLGYDGHSGCSFGETMRSIQYLALYGEELFRKSYSQN